MKRIILITYLFFFSSVIFAQFSISGIVKNEDNELLIGANVIIEGTLNGTSCNTKGEFEFRNIPQGEYFLNASFIGYEPQIIKVVLTQNSKIEFKLFRNTTVTEEVIIQATRAGDKTPVAFSSINKEELQKQNTGQDIPSLLKLTPSLIITSDAGTGIGYTQFWIRGTDLSRINVTLNGIPMNDAESHGVFWVDIPDFASSVDNIQIQRGVGTSTNGAGAFGATVNLQTSKIEKDAYAEISNSYGSYNTFKNTIKAGSGLINDKFVFDVRLSNIKSDGFVDRAWSNLKSYYLSGAYVDKKTLIRLNVFSGWGETYQSWNGVPKAKLDNDTGEMQRYLGHWLYSQEEYDNMVKSDSRTYNLYTYDNQIDHYQQDYYQLFFTRNIIKNLTFNSALFLTRGLGYYEEYKVGQSFENYGFEPVYTEHDTISETDLIRRKWLDNYFYGATYSINYNYKKISAIIGGSWNRYDGNHFGEVSWLQFAGNNQIRKEWYRSKGVKTDLNFYAKINYQITDWINLFGDIQYRKIEHDIEGIDDDLSDITQFHDFDFINPKVGMFFNFVDNQSAYISYSIANREPKRSDFIDAPENNKPLAETLYDYEAGYKLNSNNLSIDLNLFFMDYINQLIMTGQINDVGSAIMVNVPNSYRMGIEIATSVNIFEMIDWNFNITLSQNKINNFTEYVDNWDYWYDMDNQEIQVSTRIGETDISFSPAIIAGNNFTFNLTDYLSIDVLTKYVGRQYIDNTSNLERSLDAYLVNDARINLQFKTKLLDEINFNFQVNNFLSEEYETNAWVYRYYTGGKYYTMDGYFPQAGINFMGGVTLKF
jgi:iron complex outermembrane receptor protein